MRTTWRCGTGARSASRRTRRLRFFPHGRATAARIAAGATDPATGARLIFNDRRNAALAGIFMAPVVALLLASVREWVAAVGGRKAAVMKETPFGERVCVKTEARKDGTTEHGVSSHLPTFRPATPALGDHRHA